LLHFFRKQKKRKLKVKTFQNDPVIKQSELNVAMLIFCERKKKKKKKKRQELHVDLVIKYFGIAILGLFFLDCLCSCYILYRLPTDYIDFSLFVLAIVDMDDFTMEVHHGGSFAHDPLRYEGGTISLYKNNIRDYWSSLELKDMVGKLGYLSYGTLQYRLPTVGMEDGGLRVVSIDSDKDAMAMVDAVEGHNVIELFVEHCVDVPDAVEEHRTITAGFEVDEDVWFDNVFEECNEGNEVVDTRLPDISEEFSNSEESSDDDGHSNGTNERCVRKLVTYSDMESDEDLRDSLYFGQGGIEQERIKTGLSDNEEAYMSEELLSMDDDDVRPQYPMYKPPKKAKYIKFEIGMKFNSLEEFKNVVTDYAIHGGHGIQFEKNDKVRVKAVCKKGCKWVAYAVKMAGEMTCQLRTFVNEHTCSRSYLNSRATSKWLGKKLTNRINEQPDMPCSTIQEKVHKRFVVNISRSKAYRAKKNFFGKD
jgi:hypothetical protein